VLLLVYYQLPGTSEVTHRIVPYLDPDGIEMVSESQSVSV
jgi:hypothetical protein